MIRVGVVVGRGFFSIFGDRVLPSVSARERVVVLKHSGLLIWCIRILHGAILISWVDLSGRLRLNEIYLVPLHLGIFSIDG